MERKYTDKINNKLLRIIKLIGRYSDEFGADAYIIGGIVRDIVLGIPNFDIDILVNGDGIAFAKYMAKKACVKHKQFDQFGTAKLIFPNNIVIDIAGCRKERYANSGVLPTISSGNFMDDMKRRDFTINTLAMSINNETFGKLIDLFDGVKDIEKKKIRVLHDYSFRDDPTRILRAIRFEQRFNFHIDKKTCNLIKFAMKNKFSENVKPQRYFSEFKKILLEDAPEKALKRLYGFRGLNFLNKDIKLNIEQLSKITSGLQNASYKNTSIFSDVEKWMLYFLSIMKTISTTKRLNAISRLGLARANKESIIHLDIVDDIEKELSVRRLKNSRIYCPLNLLNKDVAVFIMLSSNKIIVRNRILRYFRKFYNVDTIINGNYVKKVSKFSGKEVGRLLKELLYAKLDYNFTKKGEEVKYLKYLLSKK